MESQWSDQEARRYLDDYSREWGEDLALRTYTAHLIGKEPSLVLHGGGNTSVKGQTQDLWGKSIAALFVKASGFDLASIQPEDHCILELEPLLELEKINRLSDQQMISILRRFRIDNRSANPSIEALVHAFIPRKYIDHTHANAILALTNQPNPQQIIRDALGQDVAIVEYLEPGFQLAKAMAETYRENPDCRGAVWIRHGLTTWGETASE
jgi:rhamnose utilization protein RhaD (predicted bifunctional aldolase and dehydrogenase)